MQVNEFLSGLKNIQGSYQTVYMWGVFGSPVTEDLIRKKALQYPAWYTSSRQLALKGKVGYWGFDCVCLLKAVLWGWTGDKGKSYGGAAYTSNGVPDLDANAMLQVCTGVSGDFSALVPGEALWVPGHIGVYLGGGKAIECTTAWDGNVQISQCQNIQYQNGAKNRFWQKHGFLPYLDYGGAREEEEDMTRYNSLDEIPESLRPHIKKLVDRKIIYGASQGKLDLSLDMIRLLVFNDRAGLYE